MRKRHGIIVRHICADGFFSEILKDDVIIARYPDDCLASNSLYITSKLWKQIYRGQISYDMAPAYVYLPGKDIKSAVETWDQAGFERVLLPILRKQGNLGNQISIYEENKNLKDDAEIYVIYDVLVRFYLYCREHNIVVEREGIEGLRINTAVEALTDLASECIDCTESPQFVDALKHIHPTAVELEYEGKKYLVKERAISTFEHVKGEAHKSPQVHDIDSLINSERTGSLASLGGTGKGVVDGALRHQMIELVGRILGQSGNPVTETERQITDFHRKVIAERRIGKTALVGLGIVAGEGELGLCLDRVYAEVRKKTRGTVSDNDCLKIAASKLSNMNSAKMLYSKEGRLHLAERIVSEEGCGGRALGPASSV